MIIRRQIYVINFIHKVVLLVNNKCNLYYSNYSFNIFYHNIVSTLVNPNHRKKENSYFYVEFSLHMEEIGFLPVKLNLIKLINEDQHKSITIVFLSCGDLGASIST